MPLALCGSPTDQHGRDMARHGSALLPFGCYIGDVAQINVPWHWHEEMEAAVVIRGTAILTAGTEQFQVQEGQGVFINSGVLHTTLPKNGPECQVHWVVFHPRLVGGNLDSVFWTDYLQPLMADEGRKGVHFNGAQSWHKQAVDAITNAWDCGVGEPPGYAFQVREALSRLVYLLCSHQPAAAVPPSKKAQRDEGRIKTMLQYIQENYASELTTSDIARSAMVSESECLRCFRSTIRTTPIQYVKQLRVQKAAELLASGTMSVAEAGALCGFEDASYFTKTFREMKGCTPSAYRARAAV